MQCMFGRIFVYSRLLDPAAIVLLKKVDDVEKSLTCLFYLLANYTISFQFYRYGSAREPTRIDSLLEPHDSKEN